MLLFIIVVCIMYTRVYNWPFNDVYIISCLFNIKNVFTIIIIVVIARKQINGLL